MAIIKKARNNRVGKDVEKRKPSYTVGENVNKCSHYGETVPSKLRLELSHDLSISIPLVYLSKEYKNTNSKRYMHLYVHHSFI